MSKDCPLFDDFGYEKIAQTLRDHNGQVLCLDTTCHKYAKGVCRGE